MIPRWCIAAGRFVAPKRSGEKHMRVSKPNRHHRWRVFRLLGAQGLETHRYRGTQVCKLGGSSPKGSADIEAAWESYPNGHQNCQVNRPVGPQAS